MATFTWKCVKHWQCPPDNPDCLACENYAPKKPQRKVDVLVEWHNDDCIVIWASEKYIEAIRKSEVTHVVYHDNAEKWSFFPDRRFTNETVRATLWNIAVNLGLSFHGDA